MKWVTKKLKIGVLRNSEAGFTLAEVMVAALILAFTMMGLVLAYMRCIELNQLSQNMFVAVTETRNKMEQIKNAIEVSIEDPSVNIATVIAQYNGISFLPTQTMSSTARGISYIRNINAELLEVTVSFCWRQTNTRVIGEDKDLDGVIDAGEDTNANGIIDSMVQLTNYIYTK